MRKRKEEGGRRREEKREEGKKKIKSKEIRGVAKETINDKITSRLPNYVPVPCALEWCEP